MKRRRICVVTTSRADYGVLYWLLKEIREDNALELQILATGMHLSSEFGLTYRAIEDDGFQINKRIEMLLSSDTESAVIKSMGVGLISCSTAFKELMPEIVVVLGDRYDLYPVVLAALVSRIPIAHIHGGETSQGAIDEAIRHSITKIASIHFPATTLYRKRIIQMGEDPTLVFAYGSPGLDTLYRTKLMSKKKLEAFLDFVLDGTVAIITYHPVTLETKSVTTQIGNLLSALEATHLKAVFTKANADTHGNIINQMIKEFADRDPSRYRFFDNLGQIAYMSCLKHLDVMIGNSSSGLIEAPSFGLPVVNIGDRQKGRIKAENVIDVGYSTKEIRRGIEAACAVEFKKGIRHVKNPYDAYGDGKVSYRIKEKLKTIKISPSLLKKKFYDIKF